MVSNSEIINFTLIEMLDYKKEHFLGVGNVQICGVAISYVWLSVATRGAFLFGYYVTKKGRGDLFQTFPDRIKVCRLYGYTTSC